MARQGRYKYNYIHGYEPQLFDIEADPGEWHNLADEADHREAAEALRGRILERFDPDAMASENLASLYRRRLIRDTMTKQGHTWAHFPHFDARRGALDQYLP
jgi:choline-sulfatase